MPGDSKFSGLVEAIYDAGLRPALWNDVVVRINEFAGGRACGLYSKDSISKFGVTHYYCGADPRYIHLYSDTYSRLDPLTRYRREAMIVPHGHRAGFSNSLAMAYLRLLRPQDAAHVV